jgi:hypothetical protein
VHTREVVASAGTWGELWRASTSERLAELVEVSHVLEWEPFEGMDFDDVPDEDEFGGAGYCRLTGDCRSCIGRPRGSRRVRIRWRAPGRAHAELHDRVWAGPSVACADDLS